MVALGHASRLGPTTSLTYGTIATRRRQSKPALRPALPSHQAAVKALAWSPWHRHLLMSGGGTADRMIRFWNANNGQMLNEYAVVTALWSQHDKELVSSHGYSRNQIILWKSQWSRSPRWPHQPRPRHDPVAGRHDDLLSVRGRDAALLEDPLGRRKKGARPRESRL